jgi:hypothetical protein
MSIAILVPVCSRAHTWSTFEDCFLFRRFLPSFEATRDPNQVYQIYIGVDDDDQFFLTYRYELEKIGRVILLSGCQHAPAWAWNQLAKVAYQDGHEYMFQIGDDVVIETPGWTPRFIEKLERHKRRGVVGPKNPVNFALRVGRPQIIENAFVHRSHYELFETFFHPSIRNWHCDEWLTQIYVGFCSYTFEDIIVSNGCIDKRYRIESVNVSNQIAEGRARIRRDLRGCFSFCLYGLYTDKYYRGLAENIHLIREHYPSCAIRVYASPEASDFVRGFGVDLYSTPETGSRNKSYRFLPALSNEYEFVCVRDTDSRVHARDRWCINTFLDSPYTAFTIRDHQWHAYLMMCGLWGCKGKINASSLDLISFVHGVPDGYSVDAEALNTYVYPLIRDNMIVFSHVSNGVLGNPNEKVRVIEYPLENQEFCGNVVLYKDGEPYHEFTQV